MMAGHFWPSLPQSPIWRSANLQARCCCPHQPVRLHRGLVATRAQQASAEVQQPKAPTPKSKGGNKGPGRGRGPPKASPPRSPAENGSPQGQQQQQQQASKPQPRPAQQSGSPQQQQFKSQQSQQQPRKPQSQQQQQQARQDSGTQNGQLQQRQPARPQQQGPQSRPPQQQSRGPQQQGGSQSRGPQQGGPQFRGPQQGTGPQSRGPQQQGPPFRGPQQEGATRPYQGGPNRPQQQFRPPARRPEFQMLQGSGPLQQRGPSRGPQRGPPRGPWQNDDSADDLSDLPEEPLPPPKMEPAHGMRPGMKGILANLEIEASEVRLLKADKSMIGIVPMKEAIKMAVEEEADVVLISGESAPPVCRLIAIDKFKYEQAKGERDQKRKQREARQDLKELKMRPATESHDYQVRLRSAQKFLTKGDKVKVTIQFKGREIGLRDSANDIMQRFIGDVGDLAVVSQDPAMQGRALVMVLGPNKK